MHAAASGPTFRVGCRLLAAALLILLAVTPACSFFCQAQTCSLQQTPQHHAGCHHELDAMPGHALQLQAALFPCGQYDLLALPASIGSLQSRLNSAGSDTPPLVF